MIAIRHCFFPLFIAAAVALKPSPAAGAERPNIVFILTDDQAAWTLHCLGNDQAFTPHLDRFFDQAVCLRNCFVSTPVCSPSRASLLTGRYGSELGITDWINPKVEPGVGLDPGVMTWPKALRQSGYDTCLVGKWHLGDKEEFHPHKQGFRSFKGFLGGGAPPENPILMIEEATQEFRGLTDDILTDLAVEHLEGRRNGAPFLLCIHYRCPHAPWTPVREEDAAPYRGMDPILPNPDYPDLDTERAKQKAAEYLASVTSVDRNVGRILSTLDQNGQSEKTLVVFTSDNGYNLGHNGIWHKGNGHWITNKVRGLKGADPALQRPNMYDHSLRVPTAIRWTGHLPSGSSVDQTIDSLDWFPTLLAFAGVPVPADAKVRGRDFGPLLRGEAGSWDNDLYAEYSQHHYAHTHLRMIRAGGWKLVRDYLNAGKDELYNLAEDPEEAKNRIDDPECAPVKHRLQERLTKQIQELNDPLVRDPAAPITPTSP